MQTLHELAEPLKKELEIRGLLQYRFSNSWCGRRYCVLLVAVEGPEGSGVTLTAQMLSMFFRIWGGSGVAIITMKFPSEYVTGCMARSLLRLGYSRERSMIIKISEALSFMSDMFFGLDKVLNELKELLGQAKSAVVVFDRYKYSLLACQLRYLPPSFERILFRILPPAHIVVYARRSIVATASMLKAKGDDMPGNQVYNFAKQQVEEFNYAIARARELEKCVFNESFEELCLWAEFNDFKDLVYLWDPPEILTIDTDDCFVPNNRCLERYGELAEQLASFLEERGVLKRC